MSALPEYSVTSLDVIHHMDALMLMDALPAQSVDAIISDLPYGVTSLKWDAVVPFDDLWRCVKRVLKPRGVFVTTASEPFASLLRVSNLDWYKYDWVWDKVAKADFLLAKNRPLKQHENILVFSKCGVANGPHTRMLYFPQGVKPGNRVTDQTKRRDKYASFERRSSHPDIIVHDGSNYPSSIITFSNADHTGATHPTQKPVPLYEYLIRTYTQPGDIVLDPFAGSGTTAIAARNTKRHFICGDFTREYVEAARLRLHGTGIDRLNAKDTAPLDELPLFAQAVNA